MKVDKRLYTGFTLIELLVTIAVLGIIAALAAPSVGVFVSRSAMRGISADFTLGIQRARSEAINRNECVVICMSSDASSCATTGSNWGVGWIAFTSPRCNTDATSDTDPNTADPVTFLVHDALKPRFSLESVSTVKRFIVFSARGNTSSSSMGRFNLVDTGLSSSNDPINRTFCLDKAGRVRTLDYGSSC